MDDAEYAARLGKMYAKVLSLRKSSDYVVNQPQMEKLIKCIEFFIDLAEELDGNVHKTVLDPREELGDVTAEFIIIDIYGDRIPRFSEIVGWCSAIGIEPTTDGQVMISCTIPNVFVPLAN